MPFTRINIAIQPSSEISAAAIELSRDISQKSDAYFVLDGLHFFPHITLYSPEYPEHSFDKILITVEEVVTQMPPFVATFTSFTSDRGTIILEIEKSQELERLHTTLLYRLNPFRENHIREKYMLPGVLQSYTSLQQQYIRDLGYPDVEKNFKPHITITSLKNEDTASAMTSQLHFPLPSFHVNHVAAYTMGKLGTCTGLLREFSLV